MATKKDLVEAYSFNRRRLVTAFVSGAPGGREVEPSRPGRMVVGGAALAVLLIAGAAIAGTLTKSAPVDWSQPGLVTDDRGALYVILDKGSSPGQPTLRPVINVTSAQLILGADSKTRSVRQRDLDARDKGPAIGILDAPSTVPAADRLIQSGWTSCTGDGQGLRTLIAASTPVRRTPSAGLLVQGPDGVRYLVAESAAPRVPQRAYRYALPDAPGALDALLPALAKASPQSIVKVPAEWLALIPEGAPLTAQGLGVPDFGKPAGLPGYGDALVGDITERDSLRYMITKQGVVQLTPFVEAVLKATSPGGRAPATVPLGGGARFDIADVDYFADQRWPSVTLPGVAQRTDEVCAVLETAKDQLPAVRIGIADEGSDLAEPVAPGTAPIRVTSGRGALVRVGGFDASTARAVYVVDDRGRTYPLTSSVEVANLGYAKVPAVVVPDSWNRLFAAGPELAQLAALCPPAVSQGRPAPAGGAPGGACS